MSSVVNYREAHSTGETLSWEEYLMKLVVGYIVEEMVPTKGNARPPQIKIFAG